MLIVVRQTALLLFVSLPNSVALATKENLQSQRGMLHGVTSRLNVVTSILLSCIFAKYYECEKIAYCIDMSVLLGNSLCVKLIQNACGTQVAYFPYPYV